MNIYLIGVLISIVVYIFIGNYAGRKVKNVDDYYVSGRNATTILIAGTLFASMLSTNGFMGDTAYAYTGHATSIMLLNTFCAGGYILGPMFFGRYLRRSEVLTMPEYFGKRFNSKRIQSFAGITTMISLSAYLLAVMQGTGILMGELTGFSYGFCLVIGFICFTSFTFYSGSSGVILTDTIMFMIFIFATILAAPFILGEAGGIKDLVVNLFNSPNTPTDLLTYHGTLGIGESAFDAVAYAVTMGIAWLITVAVSPWQASRNLMAKNEHVTIRAGAIAAICTTVFLILLYIISISMNLINPNIQPVENVIIWACMNVVPVIIGVLVLTGIMAAGLSSASTFLSVVGFSITNDIVPDKFSDEKKKLLVSRVSILIVAVIALGLAYFMPTSIRILSWFASTIIAAAWGPVAIMSIWSKKINERAAFLGMVMGFLGNIIARGISEFTPIVLKNLCDPFFIGLALSFLGIYIGIKTSQTTPEEEKFLAEIHVTPESEKDPALFRRDRVYGNILIVLGVLTGLALLLFWAIPFNQLTAML